MKFVGAPRVAHRVGRYVASAVRHRGQLCTVVNPLSSTYRSGKVVQTNRATSLPRQINTLFDYFNLCAEEYMFYEAGYIDERVWQAWLRGMCYFAGDEAVRRLWESEIRSCSYYHCKMSLIDALDSLQPKG